MADSDATSSANAQNELKKRARRRLVGATALALTAAIVLPMIMDHEPRPPAQEIQIRIPTQDDGPYTARLGEAPPSPNEPLSGTSKGEGARREGREAAAMTPSAEAARPTEAPSAAAMPARGDGKAADAGRNIEASAEKAARANDASSTAAAKPERSVTSAEEARAAALLAGGGSSSGEWVIQLGAYREPAKARNLVAKLKEMGLPTYTEKIEAQHGPMTRVRAGPFASRDAAEKALKRVRIVGVDGPIAQR